VLTAAPLSGVDFLRDACREIRLLLGRLIRGDPAGRLGGVDLGGRVGDERGDETVTALARCGIRDLRERYSLGGGLLLTYVGRLDPAKYPLDLLECLCSVHRRCPEAVLACAGSGSQIAEMQQQIRSRFYTDELQLKDSPQMTAMESQIRYELMQRILGAPLNHLCVAQYSGVTSLSATASSCFRN